MLLRSTRYQGQGVEPDGARAVDFFKKACDADFRNGCFMLSVMHLTGLAQYCCTFWRGGGLLTFVSVCLCVCVRLCLSVCVSVFVFGIFEPVHLRWRRISAL